MNRTDLILATTLLVWIALFLAVPGCWVNG